MVQDHKSLSEAKAVSGVPFFSDWNSAIISIFPDEGSSYDASVNLAEAYSVNLMYTRPATTPADQLVAVRSKCSACPWEIVPWAHFGEQVDWVPDNLACVPPSMAHNNVTVHLHSISFGHYAVVTLNKVAQPRPWRVRLYACSLTDSLTGAFCWARCCPYHQRELLDAEG